MTAIKVKQWAVEGGFFKPLKLELDPKDVSGVLHDDVNLSV